MEFKDEIINTLKNEIRRYKSENEKSEKEIKHHTNCISYNEVNIKKREKFIAELQVPKVEEKTVSINIKQPEYKISKAKLKEFVKAIIDELKEEGVIK